MADEGFLLNRKDRNTLVELINWWKREGTTIGVRGSRPQPNEEDDVGKYIARTVTPITALASHTTGTGTGTVVNDDVPGYGTCEIYKLFQISDIPGDVVMYPAGFSRTVYNLSLDQVDKDEWVHVSQDNFGIWWLLDDQIRNRILDWDIDFVSNVCVNYSTNTTIVEHTVKNVLSGVLVKTYCKTNPTNCCSGIPFTCCDITYILPNEVDACITESNCPCFVVGSSVHFVYVVGPFGLSGHYQATFPFACTGGGLLYLIPTCHGAPSPGISWQLSVLGGGIDCLPNGGGAEIPCGTPLFPFLITAPAMPCLIGAEADCKSVTLNVGGSCPGTTGTGTGTIGGTSNPCCVAGLPPLVFITLNEDCFAGTYPMVFNSSSHIWIYTELDKCGGKGENFSAALQCFEGNWVVSVVCSKSTTIQSWQWTIAPTCTLPMTLASMLPLTSGGVTPCISGPGGVSGSIHL